MNKNTLIDEYMLEVFDEYLKEFEVDVISFTTSGFSHVECSPAFSIPAKGCDGLLTRGKGKDNCVRTHYCLAISEDGRHLFGILNFHILTDPINERYPELRNESDIWIMTAEKCIELIHSSKQGDKLYRRCLFVADMESLK